MIDTITPEMIFIRDENGQEIKPKEITVQEDAEGVYAITIVISSSDARR